ncbi:MAG: hypothetical protein MI747_13790, partial [Desulfobacterales bacterium]|nr:hypothetical protein [Desulfobacterales bacterium]
LMLLNHARDVYSINWSSRTTSLVSIDGQGHGDHASLLTYLNYARDRVPGRFITVTNYDNAAGTRIGTVWYDKTDRVIRKVNTNAPAATQNLNLIDIYEGKMYLTATHQQRVELWVADAATGNIEHRYGMSDVPTSGSQRLSGVWHNGHQLIFEQTSTSSTGNRVARRYRLDSDGLKLVTIKGNESLVSQYRSRTPNSNWFDDVLASADGHIAWTQTAGTTPVNIGSYSDAEADEWVLVSGARSRVWIKDGSTIERVVPIMSNIPDDLHFFGRDSSQNVDLFLFYSASQKRLYRQEGNPGQWNYWEGSSEKVKDGNFNVTSHWTLAGDAARVAEATPGQYHVGINDGSISQSFNDLHAGSHYALALEVGGGSATTGTGTLKIFWNNDEVGTVDWATGMATKEIMVVASNNIRNDLRIEVDPDDGVTSPPRFFVDDVSLKLSPITEYDGVENLMTLGAHPIFETLHGQIRQLETSGGTQLIGVNETWLKEHPNRTAVVHPDQDFLEDHTSHDDERPADQPTPSETTEQLNWRIDLRRLVRKEGLDADAVLTVNGITTSTGTGVPVWYDAGSDKYVIAPAVDTGSLLYLGLTQDETRAVLYNPGSDQVFTQSLLDETNLSTMFGTDHVLESTAVIPSLTDVFAGTSLTVDEVVPHDGNQYLVTTNQGLAFLVGGGTSPSLAAVLDSWTGTQAQLEALFTTYSHEDVVRVFREASNGSEIQHWWLSDNNKWASLSGRERDEIEIIGESTDRTKLYLYDKTAGEVIELSQSATLSLTTGTAGRVIDTVYSVQRFVGTTDTLYLAAADVSGNTTTRNVVPPILHGVSSLVLSGGNGADQFMISQAVWNHHDTIVIESHHTSRRMDTVQFGAGIDSSRMVVSRDDNGGLVLWDTHTGKRLVLRGVLSDDADQRVVHSNIEVQYAGLPTFSLDSLVNSIQGSTTADNIRSLDEDDVVRGGLNDDTINTGAGDDVIYGEAGDDTINAGDDDDIIVGGRGADVIDGGIGSDTVVFMGTPTAATGVVVNLALGTGSGGDAQGDTYTQVENVMGSVYADTLTGNDQANHLSGNGGNDTIDGGGGNDMLTGGSGTDILIGGEGADTYVINPGDENVTIRNSQTGAGVNILRLNVNREDFTVTKQGDHLRITLSGTPTTQVTVENWFTDTTVRSLKLLTQDHYLLTPDTVAVSQGQSSSSAPVVSFAEVALDYSNLAQGQTIDPGDSTQDSIAKITGTPSADVIIGNGLDNIIVGNGGADTLRGRGGSDTYVIGANAGLITIDENTLNDETDNIVLDMPAGSFTGSRLVDSSIYGESDLFIDTNQGTTIKLLSWSSYDVEKDILLTIQGKSYTFDDAGQSQLVSIDLSHEAAGQQQILPTGAYTLRGTDFTDVLTGNALNNQIFGGGGGQDTLSGLNGADTYVVDLDPATAVIVPSSPTSVAAEIEGAGGRLITIDNQATDGRVDVIKLGNVSLDNMNTARAGNDLVIYKGDLDLSTSPNALPNRGVRVLDWFVNSAARHLAVEDSRGYIARLDAGGNTSEIIGINDSIQTQGQTRNLTDTLFSNVIKVTGSPGDDTYTGNDNDNIFVLTSGGGDTVTGGNGQDTYYIGLDASADEVIQLRNNGTDGKVDRIILDGTIDDVSITMLEFESNSVQFQLDNNITVNLGPAQAGQDEMPFILTTSEGYTFRIRSTGEFVFDTVDISGTSATELDMNTLTAISPPFNGGYGDGLTFIPFSFFLPRDPRLATTLKGGKTTELLAGDNDNETLIVTQTRSQGVTLRGRGGSDTYVTGRTGRYTVDNSDTSGARDLVFLDHDFQDLVLSKNSNDLVVESHASDFQLTVTSYLMAGTAGNMFRHLDFITRDKVRFTVPGNLPGLASGAKLRPTITGLDLSSDTQARTIDLRNGDAYGHGRMAVTDFEASVTAATTVTSGDDSIRISTGNEGDIITTGAGNDTIHAYGGKDVIIAGAGGDTLYGGGGDDRLDGGSGNDFLIGGSGADWLYGGSGYDTAVFYGNADDSTGVTVNLNTGVGNGADAQGDTYVSIENVWGSQYADHLTGNQDANILNGRGGADRLFGMGGNDLLVANEGAGSTLDGGSGTDTVDYGDFTVGIEVLWGTGRVIHRDSAGANTTTQDQLTGIESIEATDHNDLIEGDSNDNRVIAGLGNDLYLLGGGHDVVDYRDLVLTRSDNNGIWVDLLHRENIRVEAGDGATSDFLVHGLSEVEEVWGSAYHDRIYGTHGNDILAGYFGRDIIRAKYGDDLIYALGDGDKIHGGHGTDTVDYAFAGEGITADLSRGYGGNGLDTLSGIENLSGSFFNDVLVGTDTANTLAGNFGMDVIQAMGGDDTIKGLGDGDRIDGGSGTDTVTYADSGFGAFVSMGTAPLDADQLRHWQKRAVRPDYLTGVENIIGSDHNDRFETGDGVDTIRAGDGDDEFQASLGNDVLHGGDGVDTVSYSPFSNALTINMAANRVSSTGTVNFTDTLNGIERVEGGRGNDVITAAATESSYFYASRGMDSVASNALTTVDFSRLLTDDGLSLTTTDGGTNTYTASFAVQEGASQTVITGLAALIGTLEDDTFTGGGAADKFSGNAGDDVLHGGAGDDTLHGNQGDDVLHGDLGNDHLFGDAGNDTIYAGGGDDTLYGGLGNDTFYGGYGLDTLSYSHMSKGLIVNLANASVTVQGRKGFTDRVYGVERIEGGSGDDTFEAAQFGTSYFYASQGEDRVTQHDRTILDFGRLNTEGGIRFDTTRNANDTYRIGFTVAGQASATDVVGHAVIKGSIHDEIFSGTDGADEFHGAGGDDILRGGAGNDILYGNSGSDTLHGDGNDDTLYGGLGDDTLYGGDGVDTASYRDLEIGVTFDMETNRVSTTGENAFTDTLSEIERVEGGSGNDVFRSARSGHNYYYGSQGSDRVTLQTYTTIDFSRLTTDNGLRVVADSGTGNTYVITFAVDGQNSRTDLNGRPTLIGTEQNDEYLGGNAWDIVFANGGADVIRGGNGRDNLNGQDGNDTLYGDGGNDRLNGDAGDDTLYGGWGYDVLNGGDDDDTLYGEGHGDWLYGNAGNDTVHGGDGSDYIYGGLGRDTLRGNNHNDRLYGGEDNDVLYGGGHNDRLEGGQGEDILHGGWGHDLLHGDDDNDILYGNSGSDWIYGDAGDDVLHGHSYNDWLYGGEGMDILHGGSHNDQLHGGLDNDTLYGDGHHDVLTGGQGDDVLYGGWGNDTLSGNEDNDTLHGGSGNDTLRGGRGNDTLYGNSGNDRLYGEEGNDLLYAGVGNDNLYGGGGVDTVSYSELDFDLDINLATARVNLGTSYTDRLFGIERIEGGTGDDVMTAAGSGTSYFFASQGMDRVIHNAQTTVDFSRLATDNGIRLTLATTPGNTYSVAFDVGDLESRTDISGASTIIGSLQNDEFTGGNDEDRFHGNAGDDIIRGGHRQDHLYGDAGNDTLYGGHGQDFLYGGDDNDTLHGGSNVDQLEGGAGDDTLHGGWG